MANTWLEELRNLDPELAKQAQADLKGRYELGQCESDLRETQRQERIAMEHRHAAERVQLELQQLQRDTQNRLGALSNRLTLMRDDIDRQLDGVPREGGEIKDRELLERIRDAVEEIVSELPV